MNAWTKRGLVFAAVMVVIRLAQGAMINAWQTQSGLISIALLTLFIIGVVVWGVLDGRADARANRDPDRRADLAMTWLLAGLAAGFLSGAVAWLISQFYTDLPAGGLVQELTTFAAFIALVVFLPGIVGVAVGRWRVDRQFEKEPEKHHGLGVNEDRADTDVFAAVRDDAPAGEAAHETAEAEHHASAAAPTAVATIERDAPTEAIPTFEHESPTEVIRTSEGSETEAPTEQFTMPRTLPTGDDKTEVIRTHNLGKTEPDTPEKD